MAWLRFVSQDPSHAITIHLRVIVFKSLNFILRLTQTPRLPRWPLWWCSPGPCPWDSPVWWSPCSGAGAHSAQLKWLRDYGKDSYSWMLPSLFIPMLIHFLSLQAWHWFLWALSIVQAPFPAWHLNTYSIDVVYLEWLKPVNEPPSDRSLKESRAPITCEDAVMFAWAGVPTHTACEACSSLRWWV